LPEFTTFVALERWKGFSDHQPQDERMEAMAGMTQAATRKEYKSPTSALKWFFEQSRDRWKNKYKELKATVKGYKNRISDLSKSRDQWRLKAEQASKQLSAFEAEIAGLTAQITELEEKKKSKTLGQ
jgi:chromosome segregation ATPase